VLKIERAALHRASSWKDPRLTALDDFVKQRRL
jgi:hypothetical protein